MKKLVILALLIIDFSCLYGQTETDSIFIKKTIGGYLFYHQGEKLTVKQVVEVMEPNLKAAVRMSEAQESYIFGNLLGFAGGFLVGWPIVTALSGGDPNWNLAAIGAGLMVVSIPLNQNFKRKAQKAVQLYNAGLSTACFEDKSLKLMVSGNQIGFMLRF